MRRRQVKGSEVKGTGEAGGRIRKGPWKEKRPGEEMIVEEDRGIRRNFYRGRPIFRT